jgi:hypothetical protein
MFAKALITGVGLMVIVKITVVLVHPLIVAVTETVEVITAPVLFTGATYDVISPIPLAARPTAVFVFVQLNISPPPVLAVKEAGATD